jgi:hypothetical protein
MRTSPGSTFAAALLSAALLFALATSIAPPAGAATFTLINQDAAGEGFNDPTPVAPVGGNSGTTLGEQRLNVFIAAGNIWGAILPDNVTIRIQANFNPLAPCDSVSGVLGSAGAISAVSNFPGALVPNTLYSIALGNKLADSDLAPATNDIQAQFNSSVDNGACLGVTNWYYGFDHNEGNNIDLLSVVTHEIGHGLGFQTFTNTSTGAFLSSTPDIYARNLFDNTTGLLWDQMTNNQRKASAINTGQLVWNGPNVKNGAPLFLGAAAIVRIDTPAAIAGEKAYGTAEFGAAPSDPPIQAQVVLAVDGVAPTSDACEPLVNAAQLAGKIALIDRGVCNFTAKAAAAQAAGALAVIIGNNAAGPPPGMSGSDPSITIPVVSITQTDASAIKAQLAGGVTATIGLDASHLAGTDAQGRPRMYAPNPLEPGSSVSHWDTPETPNLLMEPFINSDLTGVDLTQYAFADIGWLGTVTAVASGPAPVVPARAFSAPNPFSAATSITFSLPHSGKTEVEIYDVRGGLVKRLPVSWRPSGTQSVDWDGTDARSRTAPTGVYYWRVRIEGVEAPLSGRMVRIN